MPSSSYRLIRRVLSSAGETPLRERSVAHLRQRFDDKLRRLGRRTLHDLAPATAAGELVYWVVGARETGALTGRVVLYVHGGAFCAGSPRLYSGVAARIGQVTGARVATVAYRLAPEHPFPAAIEDVKGAYRALRGIGADPAQLIVVGDSAGGGLALSALTALRDEGQPMAAAMILLSPWVDLSMSGSSVRGNAKRDPVVREPGMRHLAATYLNGHDARDPRASPLFAGMAGLPPCFLQVGETELLLSDSTRLAEALEQAGVPVALDVRQHMFHGFYVMGELPEVRDALASVGSFVSRRLEGLA